MTQEHEPIEITESMEEPQDCSFFFLDIDNGAVGTVAVVGERGWMLPGMQGSYSWEQVRDHNIGYHIQPLAAHDARIRAEASCDIKNSEITVFAQAMFKELEKYGFFACGFTDREEAYENAFEDSENGLYGYDAVEAGIKAVNQLRETPKEE